MNIKEKQYIFWDLDGTLTNSAKGITNCIKYALEALGIEENDMEKLLKFIGPPLRVSFSGFYGLDEEKTKFAVAKYRERYADIGIFENSVYEGIKELLKKLKEAGKKLCIATSKPEVYMIKIIEKYGIAQYFDFVMGSRLDGSLDNKADVIQALMAKIGLTAEDSYKVVMIGDRFYDIEGAKACGIESVGVKYGFAAEGELEEHGADYVVETVEELGKLLI